MKDNKNDLVNFLAPTIFIDSSNEELVAFANDIIEQAQAKTDKEKAIALYYVIREKLKYNPYRFLYLPQDFVASKILTYNEGHCIVKAILLTAATRAIGIPSRLGFADVRNHLATPRFVEFLQTDIFAFHGYSDIYIDGKWVKATPAFNAALCEKFGVEPLEFDGENDSIFHEFDKEGGKYMEYVNDHGTFADFPYELMISTFIKTYPHLVSNPPFDFKGDLEAEAEKIIAKFNRPK